MPDLPTGTVTFLFTDIEGSTKLLHELGGRYSEALREHRRVVRDAVARHGGVEVDTQGDAFLIAFADATEAVAAAREAQKALGSGPVRVRMGLHAGEPELTEEGYVGSDVHLGARIAAAGHGGQVLLSKRTRDAVGDAPHALDLGEHRLKDFAEPVWIYQLGTERFPPLKTISNTNLPRPASSFVGREREVAEIRARLLNGARMLTLTGPGGTGKTRLATEVAAQLVPDFKSGVFWVDLAAVRDPALVLQAVAQTIGAKDGLVEHIGEREMLLVLDNLEQVVQAAPDLANIVVSCPNLHLLVTSRERLRVRGEVDYAVPPLTEGEAVDLFTQRSGITADPTIGELCRRLDNLPLAIELGAARATVLSPAQILERLAKRLDLLKGGRDAEARQQTLRATIEWSYDLLTEEEKALLARLSVFSGGCTLQAAEEVADADLDTLQSLVDKSLVRHTGGRFGMLETIREYATERLEASGDAETMRQNHVSFFSALAERVYRERFTSSASHPIVDDELDNMRAALDHAAIMDTQIEAQLAGALAYFMSLRGLWGEAGDRLAAAVARYAERDTIRARALSYFGEGIRPEGEAIAKLEEALSLWREQGDAAGEALALDMIAYKRISLAQHEAARETFEQSLALRQKAGAPEIESWYALGGLCQILVAAEEYERAEPMARRLFEMGERYDNLDAQGDGLHYFADCALLRGDYAEAEKRYVRALGHTWSCGLIRQSIAELLGIAMSAAGQGENARAVRLAVAAEAQREAIGIKPLNPAHWWKMLEERFIERAQSQLGADELDEAERAGRSAAFDAIVNDQIAGK